MDLIKTCRHFTCHVTLNMSTHLYRLQGHSVILHVPKLYDCKGHADKEYIPVARLNQDKKMEAINDERFLCFQYCSFDVSKYSYTACTFRETVI
jgi:hypothetical protein